jgi:hypothetical protein
MMTSLIVYAVIFGGLALGLFGMVRSHDNGIRNAQQAKDQVLLTACKTNEKTATDANVSLQASIDVIEKDRVKQNDAVLAWKGLADRAATVADNEIKTKGPLLDQLKKAREDATTKGLRAAGAETAAQMCAEIDADSKEFAAQRAVLFPSVKPQGVMGVSK